MSPLDVPTQHQLAAAAFGRLVDQVADGQWCEPTPCPAWNVRQLVNHVVYENRWAVPLFAGKSVADIGDILDGDLLGANPVAAWRQSVAEARTAIDEPDAMTRTVHLSFGDVTGEEYSHQLVADLLIHGWDLARAIGADESLDATLVEHVAAWFAGCEDGYRAAGAIGPRQPASTGDQAAELLAAFGRHPASDDTLSVIRGFNQAFGRHDVDAVMAMMTDDCLFEDTSPPHGRRHHGQTAVRAVWEQLFASRPHFTTEEGVICGDRATYRWRYDFDGGSVRGIDLFRVTDGKVAEKLAYVKG
jgi:uncharacterized protein (TIGR03086 family)